MTARSPGAPRSCTSLSPDSLAGGRVVASSQWGWGGPWKEVLRQQHLLNRADFKSVHASLQQFHIWEIPSHTRQDKGPEMHGQERVLRRCLTGRGCGQDLSVRRWGTGDAAHRPSTRQGTGQRVTPLMSAMATAPRPRQPSPPATPRWPLFLFGLKL